MTKTLHIIGSGLAGSEAAWQAAERGVAVVIHEMRPLHKTEAHHTGFCAELVCSNSFRSDDHARNAVGLLHEEMRRCGSLILRCADAHKVPAGSALAMDRDAFAQAVTQALEAHPNISFLREEVTALPSAADGLSIVATGPLTSPALSQAILAQTGEQYLAFFDAIAPIVHRESIDMSKAWFQSRYDKVGPGGTGKDYINCPLDRDQYYAFIDALIAGEKTEFKEWEKSTPYFEGCLPIEVMAARGKETLRFGPMKPVGLTNPHRQSAMVSADGMAAASPHTNPLPQAREGTAAFPSPVHGRGQRGLANNVSLAAACEGKPYAVVQLRQDNKLGTLYNIVGFQTKLKYAEQSRVFRMIPGLEEAEFARLGGIHRNTFINSPVLLDATLRLKSAPHLRFAGQVTGVEGYVESAACGLLAGHFAAEELAGTALNPPPATTALGALLNHITGGAEAASFQPMNVNFGLFPPLTGGRIGKDQRPNAYTSRALNDLAGWVDARRDAA